MKSKGLERQNQLLDKLDSTPLHCPSCNGQHNVKEIQGDNYKLNNGSEQGFCPQTGAGLTRQFGLFSGEMYLTLNGKIK